MRMTEVETHKARKAHRCEWCWQTIKAGETYNRYRFYANGDAGTVKMHPECMEAMQEEAADWGGYFEWTPGQERPKVGAGETTTVTREMIGAAHDVMLAKGDFVLSATLLERIYLAMDAKRHND